MHAEEKNLIDGLFYRLREAEQHTAPREAAAEALINEHLARQPAAPYYMAQAIVVQEQAIEQMDARVKQLEAQIETLQRNQSTAPPSSGGFLASLFGGGRSQPPAQPAQPAAMPRQPSTVMGMNAQPARSGWQEPSAGAGQAPAARFGQPSGGLAARGAQPQQGGGFLSGALQTAAGVAGGMVVGNMLMNMFKDDEAAQVAEQAGDEASQVADAVPPVEEHYADSGFFGGDEGGDFFAGDDEDFV